MEGNELMAVLRREDVHRMAEDLGLVLLGVAGAEPFASTEQVLRDRKDAGLSSDMQFTYRNPARSTDPQRVLSGARAIIVAGLPYSHDDPTDPGPGTGVIARYVRRDFYADLRARLESLRGQLVAAGYEAVIALDSNALVDKPAAVRAGLGWYGKNSLVLRRDVGSEMVLGSIVTTAPLDLSAEPVPDGCGSCTRCIDLCPTAAIGPEGAVDARRCLAWLVQSPLPLAPAMRIALGGRVYGCDDCQVVCPVNRRVTIRRRGESSPITADDAYVDLAAALLLGDEELLQRYGHWYIPRRDPQFLRRNLLYALANVGDPADRRTIEVIAMCLQSEEDEVVAAAVWAARRLGHPELLRDLTSGSERTRAELDLSSEEVGGR